jgi:hypothetical protein
MSRRRSIDQLSSIFAGALPREPDWIGILEIANQELITAELYDHLRQIDALDEIPQDLLIFLEEVDNRVADRMLRLSDTLFDTLAALNQAAITPLLFKGSCWLARFDPRNPERARRRIVSDLDLLVEPTELPAAIDVLQAAGFAVIQDNRHASQHDVVVLARPSDVGAIDLHQSTSGPPGIIGLDHLHARSLATTFRGLAARISTSEDQILLLAAHDQFQDGHFWRGGFNFRHLVDIARLSSPPAQVKWGALLAMCRSSIARTAVIAQLAAARSLVAAAVPSHLPDSIWGTIHYWRQRAQLTWPLINWPFNKLGLDKNVWRNLSARARVSR